MLLVAAAAADGETIESVTATAAAAPASVAPAPTEEAQAAGEETEAQVAPAPPAPVAEEPDETQEAAPSVARETATRVTEETAPSVTESIDEVVESSPVKQAPELVENVSHDPVKRIAAVAGRLSDVPAGPVRKLVDDVAGGSLVHVASVTSTAVQGLLPPSQPTLPPSKLSLAKANPPLDPPLDSPSPRQVGQYAPSRAIALSPPQLIAAPSAAETGAGASRALERTDGEWAAPPPSTTSSGVAFSDAERGGSPAPPEIPLPAPESPGAVASGSGGQIFVPLAALLALLALVAPAVLRKLGEAPEFRPPTPFACALERPG